MHKGKCCDNVSIAPAFIVDRPSIEASESEYAASGAVNDWERCARIGARRSSSSRRGTARAVS